MHGLISRKSCFSCFSVFPTGEPSRCGQEGETLLWFDFSMQCTCCVSPAKYGEGTPTGTDNECVGDLKKKKIIKHINNSCIEFQGKNHLTHTEISAQLHTYWILNEVAYLYMQ